MFAGLAQVLCVVALVASAPAYAAEEWDCTYTTIPGAFDKNSTSSNVKFQVEGKTLDEKFPSFPKEMDRIVNLFEQMGVLQYQVLADNDIALVASNVQTRMSGPNGPVIGARIITINKSNGELRIGSVMQDGAHDLERGHCELNPATP